MSYGKQIIHLSIFEIYVVIFKEHENIQAVIQFPCRDKSGICLWGGVYCNKIVVCSPSDLECCTLYKENLAMIFYPIFKWLAGG